MCSIFGVSPTLKNSLDTIRFDSTGKFVNYLNQNAQDWAIVFNDHYETALEDYSVRIIKSSRLPTILVIPFLLKMKTFQMPTTVQIAD